MLDTNIQAQLKKLLGDNLTENVELRARLDDGDKSRQIRELSGGKSITEVLDDMTTLMETVGKL